MKKATTESFDRILARSIDEALSVYGESVKLAVYIYLEKVYGIKRTNITTGIKEFSRALEELFGLGARYVEILVIKDLHRKIGVVWEWKPSNPWALADLTFEEYVIFAKKYSDDIEDFEQRITFLVSEQEAFEANR